MRDYFGVRSIPRSAGVYCLLGFSARGLYPAYVGIASNLLNRVAQHREYRNTSVTTGASAASLDTTLVGGCRWWTNSSFNDPVRLGAAELVAFELINPVLRSRGGINRAAEALSRNPEFRDWFAAKLLIPDGQVAFPGVAELAAEVRDLRRRVEALEARLAANPNS